MVVVSIRGKDVDHLNLTATGHGRMSDDEEYYQVDERIQWYVRNEFKTTKFQITQALDVFSHEVQQRDLTYFSSMHESNQIISLFGTHFMALDWDYSKERLYGFESFTDREV